MRHTKSFRGIVHSGVLPDDISEDQQKFNTGDWSVMPAQLDRAHWLPEHDMLGQLLADTLKDAALEQVEGLSKDKAYKRWKEQRNALAWFFSPGEHPYGYEWTCLHMGLRDPDHVRDYLRRTVEGAAEIEAHLLDPENVPAPPVPERFLKQAKVRATMKAA